MSFPFDFAALDEQDNLALLIEVKANRRTDVGWATKMRGIMGSRSTAVASSTLLLVTPDRVYMWPPGAPLEAPPAESIDAEDVLRSYYEKAGLPADRRADARVFEDIVGWWLHDLATGVTSPPRGTALEAVLAGLLGTRVVSERAA